ncbi:MAG TPA: autotransporter-associated beta strand repeat-containing protein [Lacunisphaera sp.]
MLAGFFLYGPGLRAQVQVLYWDSNGTTAGAGTAPAGTWGSSSFWNSTATGSGTPGSWSSGFVAVFSAGSDTTGAYTVTVSGTQTIGGLTVEEGTPTLTGGSLSFSSATTFDITGNATINSVLAGTGNLAKAGTGTLTLGGVNTYTGTTTINGGTLAVDTLANGGTGSSVGTASNAAANLVIDGGTLRYTGGNGSTDRLFTLGVNGGTLDISNPTVAGGFTFSNTGSIALSGTNTARTLYLTGTPGYSSTVYFNSQIDDNGSGATSVVGQNGSFWRLAAANTYSGGTTVLSGGFLIAINTAGSATGTGTITVNSGGRLGIGSNSPNGAISGDVVNNGSLEFNRSTNYTYSGIISGTGTVQHNGTAGTITLTGANTYTGATVIGGSLGGALVVSSLANGGQTSGIGASSNAASNLYFSNGGTLRYTGATTSTDRLFKISGAATIDSSGTGLLTFSNTGAFTFNNPNVATTLNLTGTFIAGYNYFNPLITDNGTGATALVIGGSSNWALTSANTYSGGTTLNGNSLLADNASGSATGSGPITINAGYLQIGNGGTTGSVSGAITNNGTVNFIRSDAISFGNGISGTGSLYKAGAGTLTLAGTNTYSGFTLIGVGTLADGGTSTLSPGSAIRVASGANLVINFNETIGGLADNAGAGGNVAINAGTSLLLDMAGANSFSGVVSGAGALLKAGIGTQTLAGVNTYTGGTTINGGTLAIVGGSINHSGADLTAGSASTLAISGGGDATTYHGFIGYGASGGIATVAGSGSSWTVGDELIVGAFSGGQGNMTVSGGGTVSANRVSISYIGPATSNLTATGAGSSITSNSYVYVGSAGGNARFYLNSGATATSSTGVIGLDGGYGWSTLTGTGSTWDVSSGMYVGYNAGSTGFLQLNDNSRVNVVSGTGTIALGTNGAAGTLRIGESEYYAAGGIVNAAAITTGSGTGLVQFDTGTTRASPYYLTKDGTSGGTPVVIAGSTSVAGNNGYIVLNGANTYTGGTTLYGGTIEARTNAALGTGTITFNGGALDVASGVTLTNTLAFAPSGGTLGGSGTFGSAVTIGSNTSLAPGSSPGILTFSSGLTLASGGTLDFEVQAATGAAGTGYDLLSISGAALDITATSGSPFTLKLISLNSSGTAGAVSDFSAANTYAWTIATSTAGITGFVADKLTIDTSAFSNSLGIGSFFVTQSGNNLILNFTPVPEPSTYALMISGLALAGLQWRRPRNRV